MVETKGELTFLKKGNRIMEARANAAIFGHEGRNMTQI